MSKLPHAKGERPIFLDDAVADDLLAMVMTLAQELAVLRERCDTQERVLVSKGVLGETEIDAFEPDAAVDEAREEWRTDYIDRILHTVNARARAKIRGDGAVVEEPASRDA